MFIRLDDAWICLGTVGVTFRNWKVSHRMKRELRLKVCNSIGMTGIQKLDVYNDNH